MLSSWILEFREHVGEKNTERFPLTDGLLDRLVPDSQSGLTKCCKLLSCLICFVNGLICSPYIGIRATRQACCGFWGRQ